MEEYTGPLDPRKMGRIEKKAYWIYQKQKERSGVGYTQRQFISWYVSEFSKRSYTFAHVARFDHSQKYSFGNIVMQEARENVIERNSRHGNPGRTHRAIVATILFQTKQDAAAYFGVSQKTIYNHAQKRTKNPWKYGPKTTKEVRFSWA